uniref:ATP-dependent DNA helicase n=1 Tax=Caenorhabditis japonica TaxID=281687 RepID=A0A8R1IAX7_CAEJA
MATRATKRKSQEPEEDRQKRLHLNAVQKAIERSKETENQRTARISAVASRKAIKKSRLNVALTEPNVDTHYAGKMDQKCEHCKALYFSAEKTQRGFYNTCCSQGAVKLEVCKNFPKELQMLFLSMDPVAVDFREHCRNYNNTLAMGSFKAQLDQLTTPGPYCYRLHGQTYHFVGNLHPEVGNERKFAQVFIMDTSTAAEELASRPLIQDWCSQDLLEKLIDILKEHNPFVKSFKTMHEIEKEEEEAAHHENRPVRSVKMTFRVRTEDDQRRYQLPTATEVAVVYVGDDDYIPGERNVTVHQRGGQLTSLRVIDKECDPMVYPLLFPTGKYGWHLGINLNRAKGARKNVTALDFYSYHLHQREFFCPLFHSGKLFQQFVVDVWTKIEQGRLNFIRHNQDKLRGENLQSLQDYIEGDETGKIGIRYILPASHTGSVRNMIQQYHDAMAVVARTSADVDNVISAELPDKTDNPELFERVQKMMMHRPLDLDNRHVIPYNPWLIQKYNCHINLEVCGAISSVKYLYKYVYKGTTRASIRLQTNKDGVQHEVINEIDEYLDTRYVCAPESIWHIFSFKLSNRSVSVTMLKVHLPGKQTVTFQEGNEAVALERAKEAKTTLTAWFEINKKSEELALTDGAMPVGVYDSRVFLYNEMPEHFLFTTNNGWTARKNQRFSIGRMPFVGIRDTERYSLRQLLLYSKGATSFENLRTVNGVVFETFTEAARAAGFLEDDEVYIKSLEEAAGFQSAYQLRGFFSTLLIFGEISDKKAMWERFINDLCEDYEHQQCDRQTAEAMAYYDIYDRLAAMTHDPRAILDLEYSRVNQFPCQHIDYHQCEQDGQDMRSKLTQEQEDVVVAVLGALEQGGGQIFVDGPGGSGKTFVYNCIANIIHGERKSLLAIAWTGIAASLLPNGRTVSSVFKLATSAGSSFSSLNPRSADAKRLADVDLILWDEAPMSPKASLEAVDRFFRDMTDIDRPFGGKVVVLGGDFRQCLPVMDKGGVDEKVANCIKKSDLWRHFKTFRLTINMRVSNGDDTWKSELLAIGDGKRGDNITGAIKVQQCFKSSEDLSDDVFGELLITGAGFEEFSKVSILTPRNKEALEINDTILAKMPGTANTYRSFDKVEKSENYPDQSNHFSTELLNTMTPSGMPPHILNLKTGAIIMLLRNLDVKNCLCNGTRFVIEQMGDRVLQCKFVAGVRRGESVLIPMIKLTYDENLPFKLARLQFPIRLSFAMTINKSQGQTFDKIGLHLKERQ